MGIEPTQRTWEARILPLNYTRLLIPRQLPVTVVALLDITIRYFAQPVETEIFNSIRSHNSAVDDAFSNFGITGSPAFSQITHQTAGEAVAGPCRIIYGLK